MNINIKREGVIQSFFLLIVLLASWPAYSEPVFPTLNGRVIDEAGLLSASAKAALTGLLAKHEQETSNQVVIATVSSLQGYPIEDFGYQLGRHWGIGQKDKNNGVVLLVAPDERKVRIEVGYGLEGALTDALSKNIIETVILPQFRKDDFPKGIEEGAKAIIQVLDGTYSPQTLKSKSDSKNLDGYIIFFIIAVFFGEFLGIFLSNRVVSGLVVGGGFGVIAAFLMSSVIAGIIIGVVVFIFHVFLAGSGRGGGGWSSGYGRGGSFGGGGGFSGGGGSFGGGGASGGW